MSQKENKNLNPSFYFCVKKNGKVIDKAFTRSKRVFCRKIRMIKKQKGIKIHLRVNYGRAENCFGKIVDFVNDGLYENSNDLCLAFEAFTKKGIW